MTAESMVSEATSVRRLLARGLLITIVLAIVALIGVLTWATQNGYMTFGAACNDVGYPPGLTYDELIAKGESPYCARARLGETWF